MAYIESHQSLLNHRKTIRACSRLKLSRPLLIGHLHCLWWWGLDNADSNGRLGETFPEEIAAAAAFPDKKAEEFLETLVTVKFLDRADDGALTFHNWERYTWRYYDLKGKREDASEAGRKANHVRWHENKGVTEPDCEWCKADIRSESELPESDIRSESITHSLSPSLSELPNDQNSQTPATNVTQLPSRSGISTSPFNLMPREWADVQGKYPNESRLYEWFRDWVEWNEKRGVRASEIENKVGAFIGFVKGKTESQKTAAGAAR